MTIIIMLALMYLLYLIGCIGAYLIAYVIHYIEETKNDGK